MITQYGTPLILYSTHPQAVLQHTMLQETLAAYAQKRAKSASLPSGSAPFTSSAAFKLRPQAEAPLAKDWSHHLSIQGRGRSTSTLKKASKIASQAQLLSLGTARPASEFYPWEAMTMTTKVQGLIANGAACQPISTSCVKGESSFDLGAALNYGYAAGSPQMVRFITEHVEMIHSPPYQDWESCLTCSTTSAIDILFRVLCDRGDWIITEEYTYPGTMEAARMLGLNILTIAMDDQGLLPEDLDRKLRSWSSDSNKPSVLYTIPSGQNPTGATQSTERRKEIYAVAEYHDLLIVEDDPYYFIQLENTSNLSNGDGPLSQSDLYLRYLLPSYLSMDDSGRVLRLETSSKILAPGLRCGWLSGCTQLVSKFIGMSELTTVAPAGTSQVMLYKLLDETWGHQGLITWLDDLSARYRHRLEIMISSCERYLPLSICRWSAPKSGMFLWIQLDWTRHASIRLRGSSDCANPEVMLEVEEKVHQACIQHGVQVSKGSWFQPGLPSSSKLFFRITFAAALESDLERAIERFSRALCNEFAILT